MESQHWARRMIKSSLDEPGSCIDSATPGHLFYPQVDYWWVRSWVLDLPPVLVDGLSILRWLIKDLMIATYLVCFQEFHFRSLACLLLKHFKTFCSVLFVCFLVSRGIFFSFKFEGILVSVLLSFGLCFLTLLGCLILFLPWCFSCDIVWVPDLIIKTPVRHLSGEHPTTCNRDLRPNREPNKQPHS